MQSLREATGVESVDEIIDKFFMQRQMKQGLDAKMARMLRREAAGAEVRMVP